jgi:hypothetical protein
MYVVFSVIVVAIVVVIDLHPMEFHRCPDYDYDNDAIATNFESAVPESSS